MDEIKNKEQTAFVNDEDSYNKKTVSKPVPERNIGIDVDGDFTKDIIEAGYEGTSSQLDISKIESFTTISQNRDLLYQTIDCMAEDPTIAAALETYAEDATEPNEDGRIVWVESDDENVVKFVNFLLESIGTDKNVYSWVYSLCKYGDVYLRLFRESDVKDPLFKSEKQDKERLDEDVKFKAYSKNDNYTHYVEKVPNPAEMFELVRFGKSYAYIKAPVNQSYNKAKGNFGTNQFRYSFKKNDVELYPATEFTHACLEDDNSRQPEEVNIFLTDKDYEENTNALSYKVKRGQSILYTVFKAWREVTLLTNALMLNRLTKSAITRIVQMEVGDMPKEDVQKQLYYIKSLLEQKTALNEGQSIQEYTNPGPMENCIYVPMRNQKGQITVSSVGGDADVNSKGIADIDFFNDRLFTALRIPKQFMGYCLRGDTKIQLLNGETITIEEMFNNRSSYIGKGILGCDVNGKLVPTTIKNVALTKPLSNFIRIILDNGEHVDVTPEHKMMLRDGSFVEACDIVIGDSLMPYYNNNCDSQLYEYARYHSESRPDTYFKFETLEPKLEMLENYVPECNHKVIKVEYLDVLEPAFDIEVNSDCHTFALDCGIFVHNCNDNAGFSGGESLSIISSRYAKAIKKIQSAMVGALTDTINLMLLDKQLPTYIGKFTLKMQPPITQAELDRKDVVQGKINNIQDIMNLLDPVEDPITKLKILKSLISTVISEPEVLNILQKEIDRMEEGEEENIDDNPDSIEPRRHPSMSGGREPIERGHTIEREPEINDEMPSEPTEEPSSEDETILPTPAELDSERDFSNMSEE